MAIDENREFTTLEAFAFFISMIGVQLTSEFLAQWGTYFYAPTGDRGRIAYVSMALVPVIFIVAQIADVISNPIIGLWSDKTDPSPGKKRLIPIAGRRRPFLFWGSILMTGSAIAFWYPPVPGTSTMNLVYGTVVLSIHWSLYAMAYIPLLALAPEIARSEQARVKLGTWIAGGMTLGLAIAAILPGKLITLLDPARTETGVASPIGYQRVAILLAILSLACFQFLIWTVKERSSTSEPAAGPPLRELTSALQNPIFRLYFVIFGFFYIGLLAAQRASPYWVNLAIGGDESTLGDLGIPFIVAALFAVAICPWASRRMDIKWLMVFALGIMTIGLPLQYFIGVMDASNDTKLLFGMSLYATQGLGLGLMYVLVTPLLGAIIDLDEQRTGERREGVFNAMHAMTVKGAQLLSIALATMIMDRFGHSSDNPLGVLLVGPIAAGFCLVGLIAAFFYPVLQPSQADSN